MLPLKAIQLSYQDVGDIVWSHKQKISKFCEQKSIQFDLVVSKLRNGVYAGSIISTYLHLPMGVIEVNPADGTTTMLWPLDIDRDKQLNILVVDTTCNTGTSLNDMFQGILREQPNAKIYTYATLVAANCPETMFPNIVGEVISDFIQPPWEWLSFTPSSHLERLESGNEHQFNGKDYFITFSSQEAFELLSVQLSKNIDSNKVKIYQNYAANKNVSRSNSGLSSIDLNNYRQKGLDVYFGPIKRVIKDKVDYIKKNGVSHFVEESLEEAVLLSSECPVTHILYIEKGHLYKIHGHSYNPENFNL